MDDLVQIHQSVRSHRRPEDFDQFRIELSNFLTRVFGVRDEPHASAQIDGSRRQRFFHGESHRPVARDAGFVSESFMQRPAQTDTRIFHRVVRIDVQVPDRFDFQIEESMASKERQHMIEETDTGFDVVLAAAVEIEAQFDVGFGSLS